jgi:hypothetical protein
MYVNGGDIVDQYLKTKIPLRTSSEVEAKNIGSSLEEYCVVRHFVDTELKDLMQLNVSYPTCKEEKLWGLYEGDGCYRPLDDAACDTFFAARNFFYSLLNLLF